MKKHLLALSAAAVLLAPQSVGAEGFGIVEWSAEGMAMGGARMFAENDAANVAYNPASIVKNEGKLLKMGAAWLSPHDKYKATKATQYDQTGVPIAGGEVQSGHNRVAGVWVPHGFYTQQMTEKDWIGFGAFTRFGMTSKWEKGSLPGTNGYKNELVGMSFTPVYAHKFDKKWAASVGAELNYVDMDIYKQPLGRDVNVYGDTMEWGWNAAVNYAFDDKNEIGIVYRSEIEHSMDGKLKMNGVNVGAAYGEVTLPESYTIGYNHKFDKNTRVELQAMRTNWSSFKSLDIYNQLPPQSGMNPMSIPKNWEDGWRYAIGLEHKLSDKYTVMAGFAYDEKGMPDDTVDFMIPTGSRRTYSIGGQYHDDKQAIGVSFGWMELGPRHIHGHKGDGYYKAETWDNFVKMFAVSYQFKF